ncbi:MAG: alpha/beta fold hydrolase [Pseudomonadota bacterium]
MLHATLDGPRDAPVIVFLHAVGTTAWMWRDVVAELADFRTVLIDLPGHGMSRDTPWTSLQQSADQVADVINRHVPTSDVHLVGLSLGSYVGLNVVLRHPALCTTALFSGIHPGGMPRKWLMKCVSALAAPLAPRPAFAKRTARMMGAQTDIDGFVKAAGQTRPAAFRRATNDVVDFDVPTVAHAPETRLAFVSGSREHPLILAGLESFQDRFDGSVTAIANDLGHGWAGEDPTLFAQFVRAHIAARLPETAKDLQDG